MFFHTFMSSRFGSVFATLYYIQPSLFELQCYMTCSKRQPEEHLRSPRRSKNPSYGEARRSYNELIHERRRAVVRELNHVDINLHVCVCTRQRWTYTTYIIHWRIHPDHSEDHPWWSAFPKRRNLPSWNTFCNGSVLTNESISFCCNKPASENRRTRN